MSCRATTFSNDFREKGDIRYRSVAHRVSWIQAITLLSMDHDLSFLRRWYIAFLKRSIAISCEKREQDVMTFLELEDRDRIQFAGHWLSCIPCCAPEEMELPTSVSISFFKNRIKLNISYWLSSIRN